MARGTLFAWAGDVRGATALLVFAWLAVAAAGPARAARARGIPLRVHLDCQGQGRTKACPAFLRGFIDAASVMVPAPLARALVVVYYNVTFRGRQDLIHLRLTSRLPGAPSELEVVAEVDSRAGDDAQRRQL